MRVARFFTICGLFVADGCTRPLDDAPCPCANGYVCCAALNVCYPQGRACDGDSGSSMAGRGTGASESSGGAGSPSDPGGSAAGVGDTSGGDSGASDGRGGDTPSAGTGGSNAVTEPHFALVATQHNDVARTGANTAE